MGPCCPDLPPGVLWAKWSELATRGCSRAKLLKLATRGWFGGQVAHIGHQVALQAQIKHQSYKCPPKMFGGRGIVFGGQLSTLAVAEELLEDNCQFCHRQDLEDVCFNILLMVENLNKSHY